jgi:phosphoserine phosphatase
MSGAKLPDAGAGARPRFASVVLDVDSTLSGIEGIDWLASLRGPEMAAKISALTDRAMRGEITLDSVYGERLQMIAPTRAEIDALGRRYVEEIAPGAANAVAALRKAGVAVALVSGGLREAILPLAKIVGAGEALSAVSIHFDAQGNYAGFDDHSPLATQQGKAGVVRGLALGAPVLGVGDGATDLAMKPAVAAFGAYVGFARRAPVVRGADFVIESFAQLEALVLG